MGMVFMGDFVMHFGCPGLFLHPSCSLCTGKGNKGPGDELVGLVPNAAFLCLELMPHKALALCPVTLAYSPYLLYLLIKQRHREAVAT